jgi:hypothetical protein
MSDKLFLAPARSGLIVRDPVTATPLAAEGEYKPRNSYWIRRMKDGDAVAATPSTDKASAVKKG